MTNTERSLGCIWTLKLCIGKSQGNLWNISKTLLELEYIFSSMSEEWGSRFWYYGESTAKCLREICFLDTICGYIDITARINDDISCRVIYERNDWCRRKSVAAWIWYYSDGSWYWCSFFIGTLPEKCYEKYEIDDDECFSGRVHRESEK